MSTAQQGSNQSSSSTWTEPPWSGWIETTGDALLILEAARRGLIPRVTRRLVDSERKMITSGSVFVFDEDESGIKRWTDGFFWSPSRILGNFLLYRETDKRGAGHRGTRTDPDINDPTQYNVDGVKLEGSSLSRPKTDSSHIGVDKHRERTLMGSLTNSYKFKPDGLMKKTFSLSIDGVAQHLISYYKIEDVENGRLRAPSSLPELASLDISPEYLDKTHFRNPPKVEIGVDGIPRYRGEADDIESSPSIITGPLSSGVPLLTDGRSAEGSSNKRGKRYDPYGSPSVPKRARRNTKSAQPDDTPPAGESHSSQAVSQPPPPSVYADPGTHMPPPQGAYPPYGPPPAFFPIGSHYPAPPGHMYPQGAYPPPPPQPSSNVTPPQHPLHQPPGPPYHYPTYSQPPAGMPAGDPSQALHQGQPYYPYFAAPPHHSYAPYPGVTWPPYSGFPAQQPPQSQPPVAPTAAPSEGEQQQSSSTTEGEGSTTDT
ncbi:uncharacterized protein LACBIDRAFT_302158 [Laccaria bicolor S238N-H82]|uniref:Predicted protein n=1 Tax=Laccaria bicolor (strain S238N-H82 / ATCC MYA-4686) TaxID=486041 RepID=B0DH70_LACBS|nr:uncharacterized protein LACBIDRAFT_302158 [Laccaria bicolor S238N-H82]EDR05964.1 predicted protein [Laccaria bicolor S238N-H82]|eukprot:XP_001883252.1 predicted protein [Laccaria bicolor S238N-H82]